MPNSLLRVLACGSVDDGKSTLIGRLLFECGTIPDDVMAALRRDTRKFGTVKEGVDYALLVDGLAAEREQGITIDCAYRFFETSNRRFILADAPGHHQYTKNMITGASTCDVAIVLVDATKGILSQTRRHLAVASLLGIRDVVLAVNKMDLVRFEQSTFEAIVADFHSLLARIRTVSVSAVPVCARDGDNVTAPSHRMPWYQSGTLLEIIEEIDPPRHKSSDKPFRMPVQLVSRTGDAFRGYAGTVAAGRLEPGDSIFNASSGVEARVSRVMTFGDDVLTAMVGDPITVVLDREVDVSRGDILTTEPIPLLAEGFDAWIIWMDDTPLFRGRAYQLMLGTQMMSTATVTDIFSKLDIENFTELSAREIAANEIGRATLSVSRPLACELYKNSSELGGFILVDRLTKATVGAGMITDIRRPHANVRWHQLDIDKAARASLNGQKPAVLWFTGFSGAGKSTIANLVEKRLHAMGRHTMILDGDNVRHGLSRDLGFSTADRVENIRRIAEVAKLFVEAGLIVLVSFISPYRAERLLARDTVEAGEFLEIFVDTPIEECRRRDPKGLYQRADAGEIRSFTGVDAPYEAPQDPEIHLLTLESPAELLAEQIIARLQELKIVE